MNRLKAKKTTGFNKESHPLPSLDSFYRSSAPAAFTSVTTVVNDTEECRASAPTVGVGYVPEQQKLMMPASNSINGSQVSSELTESQTAQLWDRWLCQLATMMTAEQWAQYWNNYALLLGPNALPVHLLSFFYCERVGSATDGSVGDADVKCCLSESQPQFGTF